MKDIVIYGAGGFGREVACLINRINDEISPGNEVMWNLLGFIDDGLPIGSKNEYGEVLGGFDVLNTWEKPLSVVMAIGSPTNLKTLVNKIDNANIDFPNIISPDVVFHDYKNTSIGKGNVICVGSCISTNVKIGNFNILNGYITVGHDSRIGDFNCLMTGVRICGGVRLQDCNFLGVNSVVLQYKELACDVVLGAGSVAMRNIKNPGTFVGVPATKIKF